MQNVNPTPVSAQVSDVIPETASDGAAETATSPVSSDVSHAHDSGDPANGQPVEVPPLSDLERAELNELRKDAGLPYDEKWAPTSPHESGALPPSLADRVADLEAWAKRVDVVMAHHGIRGPQS